MSFFRKFFQNFSTKVVNGLDQKWFLLLRWVLVALKYNMQQKDWYRRCPRHVHCCTLVILKTPDLSKKVGSFLPGSQNWEKPFQISMKSGSYTQRCSGLSKSHFYWKKGHFHIGSALFCSDNLSAWEAVWIEVQVNKVCFSGHDKAYSNFVHKSGLLFAVLIGTSNKQVRQNHFPSIRHQNRCLVFWSV